MTEAFIHGLRIVPSRSKVLLFFVLTAVYWGFNGWGMQVLAQGFGMHMDFLQATTLLGVLVIGVMIPAGPGMVGTFQAAILLALGLFFPKAAVARNGMAYANVLWAVQLALQIGLGLVFLFSRHIRIGQLLPAPGVVSHELEEEAVEEAEAAQAREGAPSPARDRSCSLLARREGGRADLVELAVLGDALQRLVDVPEELGVDRLVEVRQDAVELVAAHVEGQVEVHMSSSSQRWSASRIRSAARGLGVGWGWDAAEAPARGVERDGARRSTHGPRVMTVAGRDRRIAKPSDIASLVPPARSRSRNRPWCRRAAAAVPGRQAAIRPRPLDGPAGAPINPRSRRACGRKAAARRTGSVR